jgi:small subunit ribosomal protein S21
MLKVEVKNGKIEKALKILKRKVRNTKQNQELRNRKQHTKPTEEKRAEKKKAIYIEKLKNDLED